MPQTRFWVSWRSQGSEKLNKFPIISLKHQHKFWKKTKYTFLIMLSANGCNSSILLFSIDIWVGLFQCIHKKKGITWIEIHVFQPSKNQKKSIYPISCNRQISRFFYGQVDSSIIQYYSSRRINFFLKK